MKTSENAKVESLPAGVIVMMLEGLKEANERQQQVIILLAIGWLASVICFALWCVPAFLTKG